MTNITDDIVDGYLPLNSDDKEIIVDLLFPVFQEAAEQNKNLTRDILKEKLGRYFFHWNHVRQVMDDLEEKDYVSLLTTRGGGVYSVGRKFHLWQEEMMFIEHGADSGDIQGKGKDVFLTLEAWQVEALALLFKSLASATPRRELVDKVRQASAESKNETEFLCRLMT